MNYLFKWIRNLMAVVGAIMIYGGIGNVDYYTAELGQKEPTVTWWIICIGVVLMLPTMINFLHKENYQ